jgi:hypothetical protein
MGQLILFQAAMRTFFAPMPHETQVERLARLTR